MSCCYILLNVEIAQLIEAKKEKGPETFNPSLQWFIAPEIDPKTELCYYSFSFEGDIFYIVWVTTDGGRWQIQDSFGTVLYYFPSEYVCPVSILSDWSSTPDGEKMFPLISLFISQTFPDPEVDIPTEGNNILNCDEYFSCKFVNLLKKQKAVLSDDISKIKNYQVFGLKGCHEKWENIFMRHLIMDALKCSPYGVYSEDTENCLINRLTENCNC